MTKILGVHLGMHLLEVEITNRCNLDCLHCYNRDYQLQDMPLLLLQNLIEFAEKNQVSQLVFSGGEASLYPEFPALVGFLKSRQWHTEFVIQSNGAIKKMSLEQIRAFNLVHLSFDVEDDCGVRKIFVQETLDTAKKLLAADIKTYLFVTVYPGNIDKIDGLVQLANREGVEIGFNLCFPVKNIEKLSLSAEQRIEVTKKLHVLHEQGKILRFATPFVAILEGKKTHSYCGIKGGCTAGVAVCVILPNGDVCPCPFFRLKVGNVLEESLEKIWLDSQIFAALRNRRLFDEPCGSCEYLSYCAGCRSRAFAKTGKLNGFDPFCMKNKEGA